MNNIPKLRFPEFTDAWEKCKLGEVAEFINGKAYKQEELLNEGKYKVVRVGNFNTNEHWYYSNLELENNKYMVAGDLLYLWATDFGPKFWAGEKAIFHYHIWKLELNYKIIDKNYLYVWLETDKEKIKQSTNGTTMVHVTKSTMEKRVLSFPTLPEQQKIGNLFKQLDRLITLHKRKWDDVILLKKALLQKMFPKNGSDFPEIRFPEFTDAWEKWELGKIVNIVGGGTPDTNNATYWNGNIDWYSPTEIGNEIYVSNSLKKISKLGLEKSSAKLLPANKTILFTSRASIGDMAILLKSSTTNQGFQSFVVDEEKVDIYFLYSLGFKIKHFALKNATGSTFLEISKKQLEKMEISIPTLPEQQKIGNLFKQLDRLITLHKRQHEHYQLLKKALLQQMFV